MQTPDVPTMFPSTRFTPDKDDRGVFIIDPRTKEYKSGVFEILIQESAINGYSRQVASYSEPMTYLKYKAIREEIEPMTVAELTEYFPALASPEAPTKEADPAASLVADLQAQINELQRALADAKAPKNAETSPSTSTETTGKTNGESGAKKTKQARQSTDQTDTQKSE